MIQSLHKYEDRISYLNYTLQEIRANISDEAYMELALIKVRLNNLLAEDPVGASELILEKLNMTGPLTFDIINQNKEIKFDPDAQWVR